MFILFVIVMHDIPLLCRHLYFKFIDWDHIYWLAYGIQLCISPIFLNTHVKNVIFKYDMSLFVL